MPSPSLTRLVLRKWVLEDRVGATLFCQSLVEREIASPVSICIYRTDSRY